MRRRSPTRAASEGSILAWDGAAVRGGWIRYALPSMSKVGRRGTSFSTAASIVR